MPRPPESRTRLSELVRGRRRWLLLGAAALTLLASYPFAGGALGASLAAARLSARLGVPVSIARGRAGLGTLALSQVVVGPPRAPLATIDRVEVPLAALWGGGTVRIDGPRVDLRRGGPDDNVTPVLARLGGTGRARAAAGEGAAPARRLPRVALRAGTLRLDDRTGGRSLQVERLEAEVAPGERFRVDARQVSGTVRLRGGEGDPSFGAAALQAEGPLAGLRPGSYPHVKVEEGFVRLLPTLPLTGITGTVGADGAEIRIRLAGSYGGARRALWTAEGAVDPRGDGQGPKGTLALRAERFSLAKIADVLPSSVLQPEESSIDAALDFQFSPERVAFTGNLDVAGLSLHHEKLASEPIFDLSFSLRVDGALDPARRRLEVNMLEGRLRDLVGQLSGSVELRPGTFKYRDGSEMAALPLIELAVKVPRVPCARLLSSIPAPVIRRLQGFALQGVFEADLRTKIDYADLETLELGGKVAIDGCRVLKAPDEVTRLAAESIVQTVEVPPRPGDPGPTDTLVFTIGPDNPDFVPFDGISPHLVSAIMTTEDNGFFKHRGWVTPEFKTALRRNLERGGFRYGASSITMQMVKNVLLAHEKTLSRKLQELFLVWYLEQQLARDLDPRKAKERILELYFNAIEFGPRLYGIGPAARHYFGKPASDLSPLEAAFFSSILPSPKRRYVHYCHGQLNAKWDAYVRRILKKVYERGRLTEEEYRAAAAEPFAFDVTERTLTEKQCLDWIKRITARPEPEPDPDADGL